MKAATEKQIITYQGSLIRLSVDFLIRNFGGHKKVDRYIQKAQRKKKKEKNCQPKILNLAKLFFKSEEESRHFQINKS